MIHNSYFHMFLSSLFFFLMGACVKLLDGIPISQIVFFRAFIAFVICLVMLKMQNISPWGNNKKLLIMRGIFGIFGLTIYFTTLQKLPLATAVTIQYLSPLFTSLLAMYFLKEPKNKIIFLSFILATIGIFLIKGFDTSADPFYALLGVLGAISASAAYVTIGKIKQMEHPLVVMFYFPLLTVPLITPFMINDWVTPNAYQWLLILLLGIFVQTAQYFMTLSYQKGVLGKVAIINYVGVLYALLVGHLFFQETPQLSGLIGIGLIAIGIILNTFLKK